MREPLFARTPGGARIAYDSVGDGPTLVLLHGGFIQDRRSWWTAGYVERMRERFHLLVVDLRGHGDSDRPLSPDAYTADAVTGDVAAVLDSAGVARADVWGFSYGASVALQLARVAADRVRRLILGGAGLGRWLTSEALERTISGIAILAAARNAGTLDQLPLPEAQKEFARNADLAVAAAAFRGMADWPVIEAESLRHPASFYAGSENAAGIGTLRANAAALDAVGAKRLVLDGLDHMGEFRAIDQVLPDVAEFLSNQSSNVGSRTM